MQWPQEIDNFVKMKCTAVITSEFASWDYPLLLRTGDSNPGLQNRLARLSLVHSIVLTQLNHECLPYNSCVYRPNMLTCSQLRTTQDGSLVGEMGVSRWAYRLQNAHDIMFVAHVQIPF